MTHRESGALNGNLALTRDLSAWLRSAGVQKTELAVDFADIISAADHVRAALHELLKLDVTRPEHADQAMDELGLLHTWLFTEMQHHLSELEKSWPDLEGRVLELSPEEE